MNDLPEQAIQKYNNKKYEDAITDFLLLKEQNMYDKKELYTYLLNCYYFTRNIHFLDIMDEYYVFIKEENMLTHTSFIIMILEFLENNYYIDIKKYRHIAPFLLCLFYTYKDSNEHMKRYYTQIVKEENTILKKMDYINIRVYKLKYATELFHKYVDKKYQLYRIEQDLDYLLKNTFKNVDIFLLSFQLKIISTFYLSYYGNSLLKINTLLSKLMNKYLFYLHDQTFISEIKNTNKNKNTNNKIKIGFVSNFVNLFNNSSENKRHVIDKWFYKSIESLSVTKFEKVLLVTNNEYLNKNNNCFDKVIVLKNDYELFPQYEEQMQLLKNEEFDILLYMEVGMTMTSQLLASHRMAPIQLSIGGHPITTGIHTMDYYIIKSSAINGDITSLQNSFSEKLIDINSIMGYIDRKSILNYENYLSKKEVNLPENKFLISCFQCSWKYNDLLFEIFNEILKLDNVRLILNKQDKSYEKCILDNINEKFHHKLIILPHMHHIKFMSLQKNCNLILDSFPFNGGTTTLEALGLDKIVIGLDQEYLDTTYLPQTCLNAYYKIIGIQGLTFKTIPELINAVKIVQKNPKEQERLERLISDNNNKLFHDENAVKEWERVFTSLMYN
jgi:protein O-GlcNAc transferase